MTPLNLCSQNPKKQRQVLITRKPPRHLLMPFSIPVQPPYEAEAGIAPASNGFADRRVNYFTTRPIQPILSWGQVYPRTWFSYFIRYIISLMSYHSRKYFLNEDFLSLWTQEMAYVLGFWYADGHMRHARSYRIIFSSKDKDHLISIRNSFTSNSPVVDDRNSYSLVICSKKLYFELSRLGGTSHKSASITFPKLPEQFLTDFIRGYFDGDGSVHFIHYKHTKNGKHYTNIRSNFTCGSKVFLESIKNILHSKIGLFERKVCQYGPHQFKLGYGQKDTAKLLGFMYYPGHTTALTRKAAYLPKIKAKCDII